MCIKARHGLVIASEIHTLFTKPPFEKIQARYWFEVYVDAGCGPGCISGKKCGDLEYYGMCAWSHVSFVYCKGCQLIIDMVDRRTGDSMGWPAKEEHLPDCQRHRLQIDRFRRGIRGRKVVAAAMLQDGD